MSQVIGHFINGASYTPDEPSQAVFNPASGEPQAQVLLASSGTTEQAIAAAQAAFPAWRDTPANKRAQVMFRFKALLEQHSERICQAIGREHGKILHDALGELGRGIENVEFACAAPELLKGEYSKNVGAGIDSWSEMQPLGVVAGITPFNFPAMVPMWMFPLAIVCGNTFVLKPSERDPSAPLLLAQLLQEAGLPDGVFNVINGGADCVNALLEDSRVKAVSFVGSSDIAELIYAKASAHGKRCQALGGAKNHAIVMPDADMDNVVNSLMGAAFGSSGERCMALSVAVAVGDDAANALISGLSAKMAELKAGNYLDQSNDFGPLITAAHKQKVEDYISSAEADGAKVVVDGRQLQLEDYPTGFFVGATLIDHVTAEMDSYQQEIFGPVLQVIRVDTLQQGLDLVNQHQYGNGTCLYTRDGEAARYFSDKVEAGMVGINIPLPVPVSYHSFGGWKRSLLGDLHAYGPDGVRFYTKRKTITQRWPSASLREGLNFSFPN